MTTKEGLFSKLEDFLKTRKTSDGGYADVADDEMSQLVDIVRDVLELKYERDPDGDMPVEFQLVDRTRYQAPLFMPVRRTDKPYKNESEMDLRLQAIDRYGSIASWAVQMQAHQVRGVQIDLNDATERHSPLKFNGVTYRVPAPKGLTNEQVKEVARQVLDQAIADGDMCPKDYLERQKWAGQLASEIEKRLSIRVMGSASVHSGKTVMYFEVPCLQVTIKLVDTHAPV